MTTKPDPDETRRAFLKFARAVERFNQAMLNLRNGIAAANASLQRDDDEQPPDVSSFVPLGPDDRRWSSATEDKNRP